MRAAFSMSGETKCSAALTKTNVAPQMSVIRTRRTCALSERDTQRGYQKIHCVSVVNFLIASLRVSLAQGARPSCPDDAHLGRNVCFSQSCTAFRLATHAECRAHGSCSGLAGDDLLQTITENYP